MSLTFRVIALSLITTVLLAGPLAPFAGAQQPAPAPAPGGLVQESMKSQPGDDLRYRRSYSAMYDAGAAFADLLYVPGKTVLCGLGVGVGVALMALTLGSGYHAAAEAGREGCGGKWFLTGADLVPSDSAARPFDWEADAGR